MKKTKKKYTVRDCQDESLNEYSNVNWGYAVNDGTHDVAWFRTKRQANDYKTILRHIGE